MEPQSCRHDDRERRRIFVCHTGEVFYNDDGVPTSHGEPNAVSEDMEGLEWCIGEMRDALKHPVLKPEDFEPKSWAKLIQEK
jgi:hypothetical protein